MTKRADYEINPRPSVMPGDATIGQAMQRMSDTGVGIVLIVDDGNGLAGIVVDSDLRRALLAGSDMDRPLNQVMNRRPDTLPAGLSEDKLRERTRNVVHPYMPFIDAKSRICGLIRVWQLQRGDRRLPNAAVIMAGGRGERLRQLTANRPKPMVEVGERPILETIVGHLARQGIERLYLAVNYLADQIESHFGDGKNHGIRIDYLHESEPLGTAGALAGLGDRERDPVLVMNGDILTRLNPRSLFEFHLQEEAAATMAVRNLRVEIPFGVVEMTDHRMVSIEEKPSTTHYVSAGLYVLNPDTLSLVPEGRRYDMPELLTAIDGRQAGSVVCFPVPEYWTDIGRSDDLARAREEFTTTFGSS